MRQFLTVIAFALLTIGFFTGFSNFGIPQIEPAPPPVEEAVDLSAMDIGRFLALGEKIYNGKGTCTLCHNALGRAPMLETAASTAAERLADARYAGQATDAEEYLVESMTAPSAFVVAGFGKTGSNDTESPMPAVTGGSIKLSPVEVAAVVAYLQDWGGTEVTVDIPDAAGDSAEAGDADASGEPRPVITEASDLVVEFSCDACHMIGGEGGDLGPDLSAIGAGRERDYLRRAILTPNAEIAEGFEPDVMPTDLGEQLYAAELELLVEFLAAMK